MTKCRQSPNVYGSKLLSEQTQSQSQTQCGFFACEMGMSDGGDFDVD